MIKWRLLEVKQHKYKLALGWVTIWWVVLLYDSERHVTTTISIKSLTLEGTHSNHVISGLEGLLATSGHNLVFLRLLLSISRKLVAKVVLVPCVCVLYLSDQFLAQLKVYEYAVNEYYSAVQFCCSANFIW